MFTDYLEELINALKNKAEISFNHKIVKVEPEYKFRSTNPDESVLLKNLSLLFSSEKILPSHVFDINFEEINPQYLHNCNCTVTGNLEQVMLGKDLQYLPSNNQLFIYALTLNFSSIPYTEYNAHTLTNFLDQMAMVVAGTNVDSNNNRISTSQQVRLLFNSICAWDKAFIVAKLPENVDVLYNFRHTKILFNDHIIDVNSYIGETNLSYYGAFVPKHILI